MERLSNAAVLLCGTGGVGSWAAEALARAGIRHITIMDPDTVKPSNINRQLCALHSTVGSFKVHVIAQRLKDIAPDAEITTLQQRLEPQDCQQLLDSAKWSCVIDAIDERPPKLALIAACRNQRIPIISSMGAANKMDPAQIRVADISETFGCPLAKIIRKNLRKLGVENGVRVVFSPELPRDEALGPEPEEEGQKRPIGSISFIPAIFGLRCASEAVNLILSK